MIYRLLCLAIMISTAQASDFLDKWPTGKTESMTYEIRTFKPSETTNYNRVSITKGNDGVFTVKQTMEIPGQKVKITSLEKYVGRNIRLISSENTFKFPEIMKEKLKTDSLVIKAKVVGDSLDITANADIVQVGKIAFGPDCVTSTGSQLMARSMDFEVGKTIKYSFVNLLQLSNQQFSPIEVIDSVVGRQQVTTPLGTFDCYKVSNTVPGTKGYSYYTADQVRLPVRIELVDPESEEILMTLILQNYE
nr:hypothetical protein [candidate division Zixibacteria bacterium]